MVAKFWRIDVKGDSEIKLFNKVSKVLKEIQKRTVSKK